ncbi:MAG: hypothetical protein EOO20_26370 [Chryseobacterium sp.]|nr:MAG: hypothetical protein EOO20_26370 [Chryseobacterium sp.]
MTDKKKVLANLVAVRNTIEKKYRKSYMDRKLQEHNIKEFMKPVLSSYDEHKKKKLKEEGFEIQFIVKTDGRDNAIKLKDPYGAMNYKKDDSLEIVEVLPNQLNTGVIYSKEKPADGFLKENPEEPSAFQFSVLTFLAGQPINIERNGYFYEQNELSISGYWTWEKVADALPYNFQFATTPVQE